MVCLSVIWLSLSVANAFENLYNWKPYSFLQRLRQRDRVGDLVK